MVRNILLCIIGLLLVEVGVATAQQPSPSPSPAPELKAEKVFTFNNTKNRYCECGAEARCEGPKLREGELCEVGIGDKVFVEVEGLSDAINQNKINPRELVLFLDGLPLKGVNALPVGSNRLAFDLERTEDSREAWNALLARPDLEYVRRKTVSVGFADRQPYQFSNPSNPPKIGLRVYHWGWAIFSLIGLLLVLGSFVWLAKTTGIIRDSNPTKISPENRPYSLARSQAALWFFLVIGSFLFLYLITGDYNTITDQALILMGIGTGTALGAAMIDASKRDTADNELANLEPEEARLSAEIAQPPPGITAAELAEKKAKLNEITKKISDAKSGLTKPVSDGFGKDLVNDVNGINFHRFQMLAWTVALGVLFCFGVYKDLAMPEFSGTLLALMGISSGTYLGFKIPERQT